MTSLNGGHARWAFDLSKWRPTMSDLLRATACVQLEERERLARFIFRDDFNASLIGRLLMRHFVRLASGLNGNAIHFDRDERGRPFWCRRPSNQPNCDFNVSHQGNYAVLAGHVCAAGGVDDDDDFGHQIGVDVMKIEYSGGKPLSEFFRIMHRNFSNTEWSYIRRMDTERDQTEAFMRHWCLKESYVKNIGVGITIDLQQISFDVRTPCLSVGHVVSDTCLTLSGGGAVQTDWIFEESLLDGDHCVAVAIRRSNANKSGTNVFEMVNFEQLLKDSIPLNEPDHEYCLEVMKKEYKQRR